jgi:hypothetical protein
MKIPQTPLIVSVVLAFCLIAAARVDLGVAVGSPPPPPPPTAVVAPAIPAPAPEYVWVPGHYDWLDGRWVWVEGAWVRPPHRRAVWVAPEVAFRWHRGHWR